ncbi:MAG: TolC family protein [Chitinispirillaceae bacterium]|nr:TolC family protein [Chitinispirillaceae bacterium]
MHYRALPMVLAFTLPLFAGPFTLHEAYTRLFKNNLDILAAGAELRKAEAEMVETRTVWWPSLDAGASYQYLSERNRLRLVLPPLVPGAQQINLNREIGSYDRAELGLDLSWPLFTGFSRYYAVLGKKEYVAIKKAAVEETVRRTTLSLGMLYLQWEFSYKQADMRRAFVEQLEAYTRQITAMREAGTALTSRFLEAQARLQLARVECASAEDQADSLRREIMSFVLCKDKSIVPDTAGSAFDTLPLPRRMVIDTARPELIMLSHAAGQLEVMRRSLRYRHFPVIAGLAGYRYAKPGMVMGGDEFMGYGLVGLQLKWNLFDGLKVRAQEEQLLAQLEQIDIDRTRVLERLTRTYETARSQVNSAGNRLVAVEASVEAARALAEDLKNSLDAGMITTADYLNALVNLAQAELMKEQARTAKKIAMLRMLYAMGKKLEY